MTTPPPPQSRGSLPPSVPHTKIARRTAIAHIEDRKKREITFNRRRAGLNKKAYELAALTGTQVLLLTVSSRGVVNTFATDKLKPVIDSDQGRGYIQDLFQSSSPPPPPLDPRQPSPATYYSSRGYLGLDPPLSPLPSYANHAAPTPDLSQYPSRNTMHSPGSAYLHYHYPPSPPYDYPITYKHRQQELPVPHTYYQQ